jgi:hypothetical protein
LFDFVIRPLAPGETCSDDQYIAVFISNKTDLPGRVVLRIGTAEFDVPVPPQNGIKASDEKSWRMFIENTGDAPLGVEWMKSRD